MRGDIWDYRGVVGEVEGFVELGGNHHETTLVAFLLHNFSVVALWFLLFVLKNTCWHNSKGRAINKPGIEYNKRNK